jgi:hypothetical protein
MGEKENGSRPWVLTVDLGDVAGPAIEGIAKASGISKSEAVRRAVLVVHALDFFKKSDAIVKRFLADPRKPKRGPQKATDEERHIIATYRKVYGYAGRIHTAAILGCIRHLAEGGLSLSEIAAMVEISTQDVWLAHRVARGEYVPLNELLTDKMVSRLLPLLENTEQAELESAVMVLEGTTKPKAFAYLKTKLPAEMLSAAWDDIQEARSSAEVEDLIEKYTKETL